METRELTCIGCPMGCALTVEMENGQVLSVSGHTCKKGDDYARKEVTAPTRIVTSIMRVDGGAIAMGACKTASDIPKDKIFAVMEDINKIRVQAPVKIGDVLLANVAGTGVDIIATKNIEKR